MHLIRSTKFNILDFSRACGRERTLKLVGEKIIHDAGLGNLVDEKKLGSFLTEVFKTYKTSVEYHNDIHGADVM